MPSQQLTLIADLDGIVGRGTSIPPGYELRPTDEADAAPLAKLYLVAYPNQVVATEAEAQAEMSRTFAGEYGRLDLASSPIATTTYGEVVGALMTVHEAPWSDTPPGPFIIELIVHPDHRRLGLAESLVRYAALVLDSNGARSVGLRVVSDNAAARTLYEKLGFRPWLTER